MISPRLKNFFALGFGIERGTNTDLVCYWPTLHLKLFMARRGAAVLGAPPAGVPGAPRLPGPFHNHKEQP